MLHNTPRPRKDQRSRTTAPQYVPVIANDYNWYRPLDRSQKEIRILFLEPEPLHSRKDVVVHVFNASLLDPKIPKLYGCLSYCWGDPKVTKAVQVVYTEKSESGTTELVTTQTKFQVTANLEAALRVLRSKLSRPIMWADALCIDQSDIDERSSQVSLMAEIYTQAVQTLVWLGEADSTTKEVFDFGNMIADMADRAHKIDPQTTIAGINCQRLRPLAKGEVQFSEKETSSDDFYRMRWGMQNLLARPFFRRAWVLQEVGLTSPQNVIVYCGEHSLLWQIFLNMTTFEWRAAAHQGPLQIDSRKVTRLGLRIDSQFMESGVYYTLPEIWTHLRRYSSSTQRAKIIDLIYRRLEIQATDPRDHVFALYSLADECQHQQNLHPGFNADYSRNLSEAYILFTRAVIEKLQNLAVLSAVNVFQPSKLSGEHRLPSWVPDFGNHINLRRTLGYLGYSYYRASGRSKPNLSYRDSRSLGITGFVVDKVSVEPKRGPFRMHVETENVNSSAKPAILRVEGTSDSIHYLWRALIESNKDTDTRPDLLASFILTLICSRRDVFDRAPAIINSITDVPQLFSDFAAYWKLHRGSVAELPSYTTLYSSHEELLESAKKGHAGSFGQRLYYTCHERSFVVTENGLLALVPHGTKSGDLIVICEGANVPFIVRKISAEEPHWDLQFVGECYVHGVMTGAIMNELEGGIIRREAFHLV